MYSLMHNTLSMLNGPIVGKDPDDVRKVQQVANGSAKADLAGDAVFEALEKRVLSQRPKLK
jgi:hypothetical protein